MPETVLEEIRPYSGCEMLELKIPVLPAYVSVVRLTIAAMASRCMFDIEAIEDIKVAVAEAVTNAILHSGTTYDKVTITSTFKQVEKALVIEVTDYGKGFDYEELHRPDLSKLEAGGLGLFVIKSMMDEVTIQTASGSGTKIVMSKKLGSV